MKEQFYGPDKVVNIENLADKTEHTGELVRVTLEDNSRSLTMPKSLFTLLATDEPTDMNSLHERRINPVIDGCSMLMVHYGLNYLEVLDVCRKTADKLQDAFERAANMFWTGNDQTWTTGVPFLHNKNLTDVDLILKKINQYDTKDTSADGSDTTGEAVADADTGTV